MGKKTVKYLIGLAVLLLLAYNSVYFKKLDEVKLASVPGKFNASEFAQKLWANQMNDAIANSTAINTLDSLLKNNPGSAFTTYSNSLSIGNYRYFLVKVAGEVTSVNEDDVSLAVAGTGRPLNLSLATEFIYGNAIRDASKLVAVKDFTNSKDLNDISAALNSLAKKNVILPFKTSVKKGDRVEAVGAIEVNKEHIRLDGVELIPVQLKIVQ